MFYTYALEKGTLTLNQLEMKEIWTLDDAPKEETLFLAFLASRRVDPDSIDSSIDRGKQSLRLTFTFI